MMKQHWLTFFGIALCISCGGSGLNSGGFADEVQLFREANELPLEWSDWMLTNQSTYAEAYNTGRGDSSVRIHVRYDQAITYDPPWDSEAEHMTALKTLAELQFPGWTFTFSLDDSSADVTAVLGYTGPASFADQASQTIYLINEGIFAHEFAHTLGIGHHYCDNPADVANCGTLPPGEGPCIMNRDSESWGLTEQFLLNLSDASASAIHEALLNINDRYPD